MLRILPAIEPLFPHTPDSQLAEAESQLELGAPPCKVHHAKRPFRNNFYTGNLL